MTWAHIKDDTKLQNTCYYVRSVQNHIFAEETNQLARFWWRNRKKGLAPRTLIYPGYQLYHLL